MRRLLLCLLLCWTTLGAPSAAWAHKDDTDDNPAVITDASRDPAIYNDFLRITFVPSNVEVTTPGRPSAVRAFFGSSRFYDPPLPVEAIADYNGFAADATRDLVAMTCRPHTATADPRLATWPNLAKMLASDLADRQYACPPPLSPEPGNVAYCAAKMFADAPVQPVIDGLIAALVFGKALFDLGSFIGDSYGVNANHSGLGFVVRGPAVPLNAAQVLEQSVVPEYLLRNVKLAEANCRCIRVAPYPGRDEDVLPPKLIWDKGKLDEQGACTRRVNRLPRAH